MMIIPNQRYHQDSLNDGLANILGIGHPLISNNLARPTNTLQPHLDRHGIIVEAQRIHTLLIDGLVPLEIVGKPSLVLGAHIRSHFPIIVPLDPIYPLDHTLELHGQLLHNRLGDLLHRDQRPHRLQSPRTIHHILALHEDLVVAVVGVGMQEVEAQIHMLNLTLRQHPHDNPRPLDHLIILGNALMAGLHASGARKGLVASLIVLTAHGTL